MNKENENFYHFIIGNKGYDRTNYELRKENKELQDKIDKAIEYINNLYNDEYISYGNKEEMLNILKGENNE